MPCFWIHSRTRRNFKMPPRPAVNVKTQRMAVGFMTRAISRSAVTVSAKRCSEPQHGAGQRATVILDQDFPFGVATLPDGLAGAAADEAILGWIGAIWFLAAPLLIASGTDDYLPQAPLPCGKDKRQQQETTQ